MGSQKEREYLSKTEAYLNEHLLPFWRDRVVNTPYGGFIADFERFGFCGAIAKPYDIESVAAQLNQVIAVKNKLS